MLKDIPLHNAKKYCGESRISIHEGLHRKEDYYGGVHSL